MNILNRGFLYGDGFFETIRVSDGLVPLWALHWDRISNSSRLLGFEQEPTEDSILKHILSACGPKGAYRVRLNFWRGGQGKYRPAENIAEWNIHAELYLPNTSPIERIAVCDTVFLPTGELSGVKSLSALPYVMAAKFIETHGLDDAFLLNSFGRLAECGSSNVFLRLGNSDQLLTPKLGEGCIAGVARKWTMSKTNTIEAQVTIKMLQEATEIFTTNALQGPRSILEWNGQLLEQTVSAELAKGFQGLF